VLYLLTTYIGNIQCEDLQPIHWDSDKLVCENWFGRQHFCHMDYLSYRGQYIESQCKPYYQDSQCHVDIRLFELQ
jgi:hypothetical protein